MGQTELNDDNAIVSATNDECRTATHLFDYDIHIFAPRNWNHVLTFS